MCATIRLAAVAALSVLVAAPAGAADVKTGAYPVRPVRVIVPQSPGASNDTITRIVAGRMSELLGQQFVVDNRPGAGGIIAGALTTLATPDGYTVYATATASQVIGPQTVKTVPFDPLRDFATIGLFAITQNVLVAHPNVPAKSVKELVAYIKGSPGKVNLANAGAGTQSHLAGVLLAHVAGLDVVHVPYKGGGPSVASVVAGESHATITPGPAVMSHVRANRLRAFASGGARRSPLTPGLPTLIESGINLESTGWIGLLGPKAMPRPVVDRLNATLKQVVSDPAARKQMESQGADPVVDAPAEFARFLAAEYKRFGEAIRIARLRAD